MNDQTCIFCKIIQKQIPAKIIRENDHVMVIADRSPKAPIHYLIIPKKHVAGLSDISNADTDFLLESIKMMKELGDSVEGAQAFNVIANNGAAAGQSVFHLHWHFLAGRSIYGRDLSL